MKVRIKVSGGGSAFGGLVGGGETVDVKIDAFEYEEESVTRIATTLLRAVGVGVAEGVIEYVEGSADGDDGPRAEDTTGGQDQSAHGRIGSAVRITWLDDGSSRLFIDTGRDYWSPPIEGLYEAPLLVHYDDPATVVEVVATDLTQPTRKGQ